jgi:hypothetical protein
MGLRVLSFGKLSHFSWVTLPHCQKKAQTVENLHFTFLPSGKIFSSGSKGEIAF